jgi:hypothetical protein
MVAFSALLSVLPCGINPAFTCDLMLLARAFICV